MTPAGLPPEWAIVIGLLVVFFGGGGGIVWVIRKDIRESRQGSVLEESQKLENEKAAQEIAGELRKAQREAFEDLRTLLADARNEAQAARVEAHAARLEAQQLRGIYWEFRARVENLLMQNGIAIPEWWHNPPLGGPTTERAGNG